MGKPIVGVPELYSVYRVLRSGVLTQGEKVKEFENLFSNFFENRDVVSVNSGTSALHIGLKSLGIGSGDEVLVPSFTFAATANAIILAGATPIFVDSSLDDFNIDLINIEAKITIKTKAIVVVHLFGLPCQMVSVKNLAKKHKLFVIEDAAQAHFASLDGKRVGTYGDVACFSFYPTKNMTTGEGGAVIFADAAHARIGRLLRNQGMEKKYLNEIAGFNLRMSEIQAAIGIQQLKRVMSFTERRRENASIYLQSLNQDKIRFQRVEDNAFHVYNQFTIRVHGYSRDLLAKQLRNEKIETSVFYPIPVHALKPYKESKEECPHATQLSNTVLSLPVHPAVTKRNIRRISSKINQILWRSEKINRRDEFDN